MSQDARQRVIVPSISFGDDYFAPGERVRVRPEYSGWTPYPPGRVVDSVDVGGVAWVSWVDDRGATHVSHPSFIERIS